MERGDVYHVDLDPIQGGEQAGARLFCQQPARYAVRVFRANVDGEELEEAEKKIAALPRQSAPVSTGPGLKTAHSEQSPPFVSYRVPGIDECDAETGEVLRIARHKRQPMFKGGGRNHTVSNAKRPAGGLPLAIQHAPTLGDGLCNGKNTPRKPQRDRYLDKMLKLRPSGA